MLCEWVDRTNPTALIVDVSAEITQYLRFLGVPTIAVRQHGDRSDYPHLAGYDAAYKLFAPFPQILESRSMPSWIQDKTIYTPGFSRYSDRVLSKAAARKSLSILPQQQVVVVLNGKGGAKHSLSRLALAAMATPNWLWLVVGRIEQDCQISLPNLSIKGWCEDTYVYLKAADITIASGGHNTVMEIGTAKIPFLCIPEDRPFGEQRVKAQRLEELGLCMMRETFPSIDSLEFTLSRVKQMDGSKWEQIMAADGGMQAAKAIELEVNLLNSYLESTRQHV